MVSPALAFFGSFTRGLGVAMIVLPSPQPPQPPMVTLTSFLSM
jgi:hypothetical protein